jgi:hypothetical protein
MPSEPRQKKIRRAKATARSQRRNRAITGGHWPKSALILNTSLLSGHLARARVKERGTCIRLVQTSQIRRRLRLPQDDPWTPVISIKASLYTQPPPGRYPLHHCSTTVFTRHTQRLSPGPHRRLSAFWPQSLVTKERTARGAAPKSFARDTPVIPRYAT